MNIIGHIDADCFYVSCERLRDTKLQNKPVAVLGNQGACVIACSYELRAFNVKVGMPIWEVKKLCPDAVFIKRDFRWYSVLSKAMQDILKTFSDEVEYYSIDESFVNFGDYQGDLNSLANEVKEKIFNKIGLPTSVGLASSRILSKIASKKNKPFGAFVVDKLNIEGFLKTTKVKDIPGIGSRLALRLYAIGVKTAFDYVSCDRLKIKNILHKPGEEIWYELQSSSILPIRNERPIRKNISRGGSLWGKYNDIKYIWAFVLRNLEKALDNLWFYKLETKSLSLFLLTDTGRLVKIEKTLLDYTSSYSFLMQNLKEMLFDNFNHNLSYTRLFLVLGDLKLSTSKQLNIFQTTSEKERKINNLKRTVNDKFGLFTVRSASTAYAKEVFDDKTSDFEISDVKGKFCF